MRYRDWRGQEISAREMYVAELAVHKPRKKMCVESERLRVLRLSACEPQLSRTCDQSCIISTWDHRGLSSDSDKHFGCSGIEASADCETGIELTPITNTIRSRHCADADGPCDRYTQSRFGGKLQAKPSAPDRPRIRGLLMTGIFLIRVLLGNLNRYVAASRFIASPDNCCSPTHIR